jgi:hypothetical protein
MDRVYHGSGVDTEGLAVFHRVITDNKSTIAEISVNVADHTFVGGGSSRRVKGDKYDKYTGDLLATFRAVDRLRSALKAEVDKIH